MGMPASVRAHEAAGRRVQVDGFELFVREQGSGPPVLLLHGVPASSYLYRKVLPLLAGDGFRAISFDFPGTGLSSKPRGQRYDWHQLAGAIEALRATLGLERLHLVVHDIGGPIGFEWAIRHATRLGTLTIMNTLLDVARFTPPFPMFLFRIPLLRHIVVRSMNVPMFWPIMKARGVKHVERIERSDLAAYIWLLKQGGGAASFLEIMAGFVLTESHGKWLLDGLRALEAPMQLVWGEHEVAIPRHQLDFIQENLPLEEVHWVDARHFLQEDRPEDCARHIAAFCRKHPL